MHALRGFPQPVGHLPYFIDHEDHESWTPGPRPQDKSYFLFVGRLEKLKGLQTLIQVWNRGVKVDLLVAGTGTYEPTLRQQASQNPHIKFLGALPQSRLASLYTHALACIVPSITLETFGIIIIEAFAHKTPAIVRDLGALPEIIHDSGGGYIFRTDEELLAAINALATSPALRSELGEKGYAAYVRWWSRKAHLDLYYGLIREIANQKFGHVPWEQ
jgi:glycosyltransferase involved in cell wall biosynthesis